MILQRRLIKFADLIIFPLMVVLILDLGEIASLFAFLLISVTAHISNSFAFSILRFWQSCASVASIFWLTSQLLNVIFQTQIVLLVIIATWFLYCVYGKCVDESVSKERDAVLTRAVLLLPLVYIYFIAPQSLLAQFSMLEAEDQENWMYPIVESRISNSIHFDIPFGSQGVQFFTRTIVTMFSELGATGDRNLVGLDVISAVCNSWLFLLISALVLMQLILSVLTRDSLGLFRYLALCAVAYFFVLVFFRAALFSGHLSQLVLTVTVYGYCASILLRKIPFNNRSRQVDRLASGALAWCFVGSYNPWLPIAFCAVILALICEVQNFHIRRRLKNPFVLASIGIVVVIGIFKFGNIQSRFKGLHDDGGVLFVGGIAVLWLTSFAVALFVAWLFASFGKSIVIGQFEDRASFIWLWTISTYVFLIFTVIVEGPSLAPTTYWENSFLTNRLQFLSLIVFIGYLLLPSTVKSISGFFRDKNFIYKFREILLLGLLSYVFISFIWLLSLFTGIGKPMYAAQKSALSLFSQFFWIILMFAFLRVRVMKFSRIFAHIPVVLLVAIFGLGLLPMARQIVLAKPLSDPQGFYDPWWYDEVIHELENDPEALIVCLNEEWTTPDISVYTCNRYLKTLTKYDYPASGFRYLAWYQPSEFQKIQNFFDTTGLNVSVVILSRSGVGAEAMNMFRSVDKSRLKVVVNERENKG